jgi:transposase
LAGITISQDRHADRDHNYAASTARVKNLVLRSKQLHSEVSYKKLSKGRFRWPEPAAGEVKVVLRHEELAMLLGGIDLSQTRQRPWYRSQIDSNEVDSDRINTA